VRLLRRIIAMQNSRLPAYCNRPSHSIERRSKAFADSVQFVLKIRNSRAQADFAGVLNEALYSSAGALKRLPAQMLKAATLWSKLEVQALRLGNSDELGRLVRTASTSYPDQDDKRAAFWRSAAFTRKAVVTWHNGFRAHNHCAAWRGSTPTL
jgi:hypothetical protein